ncbi:MAG TPA: YciI family protein [Polyangiaceae bacterium]|jgi:hypothetical protein
MLYAILCYDSEAVVGSWTREQDAAVLAKLDALHDRLTARERLGPLVRLMPTSTATTLRSGKETVVLDGPFAETKEQLLGLYVVECASLDEALETAKDLGHASGTPGSFEVRPVRLFRPGGLGAPHPAAGERAR